MRTCKYYLPRIIRSSRCELEDVSVDKYMEINYCEVNNGMINCPIYNANRPRTSKSSLSIESWLLKFIFVSIIILGVFYIITSYFVETLLFISPFIVLFILIKHNIFSVKKRILVFSLSLLSTWAFLIAFLLKLTNNNIDPAYKDISPLNIYMSFFKIISVLFLILTIYISFNSQINVLVKNTYNRFFKKEHELQSENIKYKDITKKEEIDMTVNEYQDGIKYDRDSSPKAWGHYKIIYSRNNKLSTFDWSTLVVYSSVLNKYIPISDFDFKNNLPPKYGFRLLLKNTSNGIILGGDVDFNFNEKKLGFFESIIGENDNTQCSKNLNECNKRNYSLINMSLMPVKGGLNKVKGTYELFNEKDAYDRFDTLIWKLSEFYNNEVFINYPLKVDDKKNSNKKVIEFYDNEQLKKYFDFLEYNNIYEYCKNIHFINSKDLVNQLIENGKKPIVNSNDVLIYTNLALKYWEEKEKYINKITNTINKDELL